MDLAGVKRAISLQNVPRPGRAAIFSYGHFGNSANRPTRPFSFSVGSATGEDGPAGYAHSTRRKASSASSVSDLSLFFFILGSISTFVAVVPANVKRK